MAPAPDDRTTWTAQQLWEAPQSWDTTPQAPPQQPWPGQQPWAGQPGWAGAPQWGSPKPRPGSVPEPQSLRTAVGMMWIGAAVHTIGTLSSFLFVDQVREQVEDELYASGQAVSQSTIDAAVTVGLVVGVFFGLLGAGLWVWMAVKNGAGRSWARIVATIFGVLGSLSALFGLLGAGIGASGATAAGVVQNLITLGLAVGILVLLWRPDNAQYYAANS